MAADWLLLGVEAERNRSVAFTGHQDYDGSADGILRAAVYRLWSEGFRFFLSGMACGFDLAAAEAVLALRGECAGMELVAVVPFAGQPDSFSDADKRRYADVLAAADRTVVLADSYSRGCYYRRNDYLVDHAVRVVAWYIRRNSGTGYTVRRARHQGIEVLNLYVHKLNPTLFRTDSLSNAPNGIFSLSGGRGRSLALPKSGKGRDFGAILFRRYSPDLWDVCTVPSCFELSYLILSYLIPCRPIPFCLVLCSPVL